MAGHSFSALIVHHQDIYMMPQFCLELSLSVFEIVAPPLTRGVENDSRLFRLGRQDCFSLVVLSFVAIISTTDIFGSFGIRFGVQLRLSSGLNLLFDFKPFQPFRSEFFHLYLDHPPLA